MYGGNGTEWSTIRSVINTSDYKTNRTPAVNHSHDYRPNCIPLIPFTITNKLTCRTPNLSEMGKQNIQAKRTISPFIYFF